MGLSGRPKGVSRVTELRRRFQDYFTEEEVQDLLDNLKRSMKKDSRLQLFVVEQLFGKAPQRLEMTGADGGVILVQISKEIADKNQINVPNQSPK